MGLRAWLAPQKLGFGQACGRIGERPVEKSSFFLFLDEDGQKEIEIESFLEYFLQVWAQSFAQNSAQLFP